MDADQNTARGIIIGSNKYLLKKRNTWLKKKKSDCSVVNLLRLVSQFGVALTERHLQMVYNVQLCQYACCIAHMTLKNS